MQLLTNELRQELPPLYSQDGNPGSLAIVKFFDPVGAATWWATEFDGEDTFFGFATLGDPGDAELGYFSLKELESIPASQERFWTGIERDISFQPRKLSDIITEVRVRR
jgi:hypothetical protein